MMSSFSTLSSLPAGQIEKIKNPPLFIVEGKAVGEGFEPPRGN